MTYSLLAHEGRIAIIQALDEQGSIEPDELADNHIERVMNHHCHLPKLSDCGIIEHYDGRIRKGPKFDEALRQLRRVKTAFC